MAELKYVAFHLTYACENKCPYCYIGNAKRENHPGFEKVKKILEKLGANKVKEILLVGGNPCTYPKLKEVVKTVRQQNMKAYILSNSLDFGKNLDFFLEKIDGFQATILGCSQKEHDSEARKKGAYKALIANIKLLNSKGKPVTIVVSLHKKNYGKIFEIVKNLVENEGIKTKELVIQRVIPRGRAEHYPELCLTKKHVRVVFEQIHQIQKKYNLKIDFEDPFPLCIVPKKQRFLQERPCEWGFFKASVNFDGGIARCGADSRFLLGNIFEIKNLQKFWRENPVLVDFRSRKWLSEECQECSLLEKCGGGCSLSKKTNKDHECDALCPFKKGGMT